jgi:precorrin-3B synthase
MSGAGFVVQGWCPGALRPMMSGDGLVVRLRPWGGRLKRAQAKGISAAARAHGNGLIDLSARGNVQLRGVTDASYPVLIETLRDLDLIDPDPAAEARPNLLVTPFADASTDRLALALGQALSEAPDLPGKFGFAVDTGDAPVLSDISADIRLERSAEGGLILRCDGLSTGAPVTEAEAPAAAVALSRWFIQAGGMTEGRGRMSALIASGARPSGQFAAAVAPAPRLAPLDPGLRREGALVAVEFGQISAETLAELARLGDLRITPWRMVLIEGLDHLPDLPGLITAPDHSLLRVVACTGAPGCRQAFAPVRPLARTLAVDVPAGRILHVSGCIKGCAHPVPADVTLVASAQGFDLIRQGSAQDRADLTGLAALQIDLKGLF